MARRKPELYFSTDVEADGPIPGPHSMLSFASVALMADGREMGAWTANLDLLPGAEADPRTAAFWKDNPDAYAATRTDPQGPAEAMKDYADWVEATAREAGARPVFVAYPAGFDFMFVYWYLLRFVGRSPFSHSALDMKTYASAVLNLPYRDSTKRNMPRSWFPEGLPHTHIALDDAREQGQLFLGMLRARSEQR